MMKKILSVTSRIFSNFNSLEIKLDNQKKVDQITLHWYPQKKGPTFNVTNAVGRRSRSFSWDEGRFGIDSEANAAQQTSGKKILPDACGEIAKTTLISQIDGVFSKLSLKQLKRMFFFGKM